MSMKQPSNSTTTERPQVKDKIIGSGTYGVVWDVLDPRTGKRVALKRITEVFYSRKTAIMALRELRMLCTFRHKNILSAIEVIRPLDLSWFDEVYILTDLLHSDLQRIIRSKQPLSAGQVKVFLYQLMRGLKYLHSAKVIHRDIKPGNLLVYDNCLLKIGDFGFARAEETDKTRRMSLRVVTQSYRAPELFLRTNHYTGAIDIWAAACVFAQLLYRKALFRPRSYANQVKQMMDLLGTPSLEDIDYASDSVKNLVARLPAKPSIIYRLQDQSPNATADAVDLLSRMLQFNPAKRISAAEALDHPYLDQGRKLYHPDLCECCGVTVHGVDIQATNFEPVATKIFDARWERNISSVKVAKKKMQRYIKKWLSWDREQLCINPKSEIFENVFV